MYHPDLPADPGRLKSPGWEGWMLRRTRASEAANRHGRPGQHLLARPEATRARGALQRPLGEDSVLLAVFERQVCATGASKPAVGLASPGFATKQNLAPVQNRVSTLVAKPRGPLEEDSVLREPLEEDFGLRGLLEEESVLRQPKASKTGTVRV